MKLRGGAQTCCVGGGVDKLSRMETKPTTWQERFGLTVCAANAIGQHIPEAAQGVAVIYALSEAGEKIYLVVESRTGGLRNQCAKRLQTGKLPATELLMVAFAGEVLPDATPETVSAACREQVSFAGELRRELRPAMR